MTKTKKLLFFILFWLVIVAVTSLLRCNPLVTDTRNESIDPVWIVVADDRCWITFNRPRTDHFQTYWYWTTREGGNMTIAGNVYHLKVVDGNMTRAYFQLGVSEEQCLNL